MGGVLFGGAAGSALPLALALCASLLAVSAADKYSAPTLDDNYASRNDYDDRGMQTLYNIARKILRGVQKSEPFPEGLFVVEGGEIKVHWDGPGNVVSYYAGVVAMVVLGLVVAVALPCAGFLWCLCGSGCKCSSGKAHKSGVRIQPYHPEAHDVELSREERHEPGPCFVPAALGVTACVIAAGACLVFATNAYMDRGIIGFPDHIIRGTNDVALFAQNSVLEVNTFFDKNYGELSLALSGILDDCQNSINDIVSSISNALPIDTLNALPDGLAAISEDLIELQKDGIAVVSSSAEIVRVVTQVKESISKKCTSDPCTSFVASLVTTAFPTLPDVSSSINTLQPFVDPSFKQSLQKGVKQLNDLEDQVKKTVDDTRKSIESSVKSAHTELQKTSKELIEKVDSVQSSIDDINKKVNETSDDLEHYESYKNGGFVVIGLVYLLIAVALAFGLVYGCCSKKNSYSILKLPVWFIFLTTCVLMLFTVVAFLAGLVGDRICEAVKDPEHNQVINLFDEMISKNRGDIVPGNISYYIKSCQRDETIYKVLQLDSTVNVDEILDIVDKFSFDQFLNQIDIEQGRIIKADLIPPEIKRNVEELENSDLATLDLTDIQTKIDEGNMIAGKVNLNEWVAGLETLETLETGLDVKDEIKSLEGLQQEVETLQTGANSLTSLIEKLQRDSRLGGNSFKEALSSFVTKIQKANDFIKSKVDFVPVANKTATEFKNEVTDYLKYVVGRVKNDALRCGPLHRVFNSIVVASCDEVLSPWNGFWAASGLCLLFFIPAAILAINLSSERR